MKKGIIILILLLITTGCIKKENNVKEQISNRKQNIINLVKQELNNDNLKSFDIEKVYLDGYYTNDSNNKYFEVDFKYTCKDNSKDCVKDFYKDDYDNSIVWIYTNFDETKILEIKKGISISFEDMNNGNYIRVGEIIK